MEQTKTCRDCGGRMTEGLLADGSYKQPVGWAPANMVKRYWGYSVVKNKGVRQVQTFRCERCGVLQSYVSA